MTVLSFSDRVWMMFGVYHVQIMNGDVIRRIEQRQDVIGHVRAAGNPGCACSRGAARGDG